MIEKRKHILGLAQEFRDICDKNNIWYSLNNETLLGICRHGGFVPWYEKFQVFITVDGYNKLKRIAGNYLVDSSTDPHHKSLLVTFVKDKNDWVNADVFLEISIAVKATNESVKKFKNKPRNFLKFLKGWRDNVKHSINDLYEPNNFQGYLKLTSRKENIHKEWIQALSMNREEKDFNGVKFKIATEWKAILTNKFGYNFMKVSTPNVWYEFPAPLKRIRVS